MTTPGEIMMGCDEIQQCLLDETLPRFDGLTEHVSACPRCLPFSQSLAAARQLRGVVPASSRRVPVAKTKRRLQLTAAMALIAAGLVTQVSLGHDALMRRLQTAPLTQAYENSAIPVVASDEDDGLAWSALRELARETDAETRRNPRVDDPATQAFGALSSWVAPHPTYPMRSLDLGDANTRIMLTSED